MCAHKLIILLVTIGVHSCNVALFNVWMTAFQKNAPDLEIFELRFCLFALFSLASFLTAIVVLVMTIKQVNREKSE
jgi:hypothetical protein